MVNQQPTPAEPYPDSYNLSDNTMACALACAIEIIASLLSGAASGTELKDIVAGPRAGRDGHFFGAIDIAAFQEVEAFKAHMDVVIDEVHKLRRRRVPLYVSREIEADFESSYRREGIPLARTTVDDIVAAAATLGVDSSDLFSLD